MSDAIQALNEVVFKAGQRGEVGEADKAVEREDELHILLTDISVIAGDALEDHVKAADKRKPRKERVYREIVRQIAVHFCDEVDDTTEGAFDTEVAVREILASFDITTVDFTGREVKIT